MLSGVSIWQLLILLVIVVLVFGTRRLGSMGGDIGAAIRNFRSALSDDDEGKGGKAPETLPPSTAAVTPASVEVKVHGDKATDMFVEGRNAERLDAANFLAITGMAERIGQQRQPVNRDFEPGQVRAPFAALLGTGGADDACGEEVALAV